MISDLTQLTLSRVPPAPTLQAYNAADELVLQRKQVYGCWSPVLTMPLVPWQRRWLRPILTGGATAPWPLKP